jgi:hypothetical protein
MKQCIFLKNPDSSYDREVRSTALHSNLTSSLHMTVYDTPWGIECPAPVCKVAQGPSKSKDRRVSPGYLNADTAAAK